MALTPIIGGSRWDSEGEAVSAALQSQCTATELSAAPRWYAVLTRSRHEKSVANLLQTYGVHVYLPLVTEVHNWSDRRKTVEVPLFSGYVFVRSVDSNEAISKVIRTDGVVSILGKCARATPIPDDEIESIKKLLKHKVPCRNHAFLDIGQRVRIRSGALAGIEGVLVAQKNETSLVISVNMIHRSIAMQIEGFEVEPIGN